jgi:hypothetical protein
MIVEKVVITITNLDDENAGIRVETFPDLPEEFEDLEDSPAYNMGVAVWDFISDMYDGEKMETLQ